MDLKQTYYVTRPFSEIVNHIYSPTIENQLLFQVYMYQCCSNPKIIQSYHTQTSY